MRVGRVLTAIVVLTMLSGCAYIRRSSVTSTPGAAEGNGPSGEPANPTSGPSISQSGRYVAFTSSASNLVPDDTNGVADVFVHDGVTGSTELVSIGALAFHGDVASYDPSISDDGRFVAFSSTTGLFTDPPARGFESRVFVRDRQLGTTTQVYGGPGAAALPTISGNGKFVAFVDGGPSSSQFQSAATPPYVFNLATQTATAMPIPGSIDSSVLFDGSRPSLSDDGTRVTYSYIVPPPANPPSPEAVTVVTVVADTTTAAIISTIRTGTIYEAHPIQRLESAISGDGTQVYVILAEGTTGSLYRYDPVHPGLEPILTDLTQPSNLRVSDDGNVVGLREGGTFVITDANGATPRVVSADTLGHPVTSLYGNVDLSGDGKWIAFASSDSGLVSNDTNGVSDVFVRATGLDGLPPS